MSSDSLTKREPKTLGSSHRASGPKARGPLAPGGVEKAAPQTRQRRRPSRSGALRASGPGLGRTGRRGIKTGKSTMPPPGEKQKTGHGETAKQKRNAPWFGDRKIYTPQNTRKGSCVRVECPATQPSD